MSRTYKNANPSGYTGQDNKPWSMKGLKGLGYEYWSRRIYYAMPGPYKYGKKKTHTKERAVERCMINDTLRGL